MRDVAGDQFPIFRKYNEIDKRSWALAAIESVNDHFSRLNINEEDFDESHIEEKWEPIPLDRADNKLNAAAEAIDKAIEVISGDNGYAANIPGEREYVLFNLKTFATYLKVRSEIYWLQIRTFALEPLARVIKRFGPAATGLVAKAARDALFDWLKTHFGKALDWFPF